MVVALDDFGLLFSSKSVALSGELGVPQFGLVGIFTRNIFVGVLQVDE